MSKQEKRQRIGLSLAVVAALGFVSADAWSAKAAQESTIAPNPLSAKVHKLTEGQLRMLIDQDLYGNTGPHPGQEVSLDFVSIEDIAIAGKSYPLIFVGADDAAHWDLFKPYLPKDLGDPPSSYEPMDDQQTLAYVQKLQNEANDKFLALEPVAYKAHHKEFAARYPGQSEETIRASVKGSYEFGDNEDIAPETQKAYYKAGALAQVAEALKFYMVYSKHLK